MRRFLFLPLIAILWMAIAAPGFGGGGGGGFSGGGGVSGAGGMGAGGLDLPNNLLTKVLVGGAFVVGLILTFRTSAYKAGPKGRVLEIIVTVAAAESIVIALDKLASTDDLGRRRIIRKLSERLSHAKLDSVHISLGRRCVSPHERAKELAARRAYQLVAGMATSERDRLDGAAIVGLVASVPHTVKLAGFGAAHLAGTLRMLVSDTSSATYVYYSPADQQKLDLKDANDQMAKLIS